MRRRRLADGTIGHRLAAMRRWIDWAGDDWASADREQFEDYCDDRDHLSARALYSEISHIAQFYVWARRAGYDVHDPTDVERPKLPRRLPRPVPADSVDQALVLAEPPMSVVIGLAADAGLRCCEIARLQWSDVDLGAGRIHVAGKGGRDRIVGIPRRLAVQLAGLDDVIGPVIGVDWTPHRVSYRTSRYLRSIGIDATAHRLRHSYATRLLEQSGGRIRVVQQALGHATVSTTELYLAFDPVTAVDAGRALI